MTSNHPPEIFPSVASHAEAWIETLVSDYQLQLQSVASHAEAWIETQY